MALDPVTTVLNIGEKVIDKLWPDPVKAAEGKLALLKLQQDGELVEIAGQIEINKEEAKNPSLFVSGWRPAVGWTCVAGLLYSFLGQPLLSWMGAIYSYPIPPVLDLGVLFSILGGMLGLGGLRTIEKTKGVASK
jgi:hypothetical protein